MTKLDSVLKSRDITLLTKVPLVKTMGFPVFTYRCESWTIKKMECQRMNVPRVHMCPPIRRQVDKEVVVHIHNGILLYKKGMHLSQF